MPIEAVPPHLRNIDEAWKGTDNASWIMRQKKRLQYLLAAGPRVTSGFWKWREIPKTLFVVHGWGMLRYENTDGTEFLNHLQYALADKPKDYYLSRIQPWTQCHFAIQWPLLIQFHWIYKRKDVVSFPAYKSEFGIDKMVAGLIGSKRDGDRWYQQTAFLGGNFE